MLSNHFLKQVNNKKIAVLGLGREGRATLNFFKKNNIEADVLDAKFDRDYINKLKNYDLIFRTPGFPRLHPKLLAAEKNGATISSHIKLFFDLCPAKIIGITGTKGKTTTALLVYKILKSKYKKSVFAAGNFGRPALDILPKLKNNSLAVLELSSFQLQDLDKSPHIAVITNITIDHLDPSGKFAPATHQTVKEYFDAKMNILKYQKPGELAVIYPSLKNKIKNVGRGKKIFPEARLLEIPIRKANRGSPDSIEDPRQSRDSIPQSGIGTKLKGRPRSRKSEFSLRGRHNLENIALAVQVGKILKVPEKSILKAVKNFKGIKHRLEFIKKIGGVSFYNDSAATNPDATLAALKSFNEPIHLILGGSDKGLDYQKLASYISKSKNIRIVALIGRIKEKLYKIFKLKPGLEIRKFKTLRESVLTLFKKAAKNEVVLLSPGAASFDMFKSYAQRGDEFKKLVKQLER